MLTFVNGNKLSASLHLNKFGGCGKKCVQIGGLSETSIHIGNAARLSNEWGQRLIPDNTEVAYLLNHDLAATPAAATTPLPPMNTMTMLVPSSFQPGGKDDIVIW